MVGLAARVLLLLQKEDGDGKLLAKAKEIGRHESPLPPATRIPVALGVSEGPVIIRGT